MTALRDQPFTCSSFLATCRDPKRCHICLQPKNAHPAPDDSWYWYSWLRFNVLLELQS